MNCLVPTAAALVIAGLCATPTIAQTDLPVREAAAKAPSLQSLVNRSADALSAEFCGWVSELEAADDGSFALGDLIQVLRATGVGAEVEGRRNRNARGDTALITALDGDQDGRVSPAEVRSAIAATFAKSLESRTSLDLDGDGILTKKEYAVGQVPKFGEFDEHGLDGHGRSHFRREDSNEDGVISLIDETFARIESRVAARVQRIGLCVAIAGRSAEGAEKLFLPSLEALLDADRETVAALWKAMECEADGPLLMTDLSAALAKLPTEQRDVLRTALNKS